MKNRYLIWLSWPEPPFRLNASDLKLFRSLVDGEVVAVRSERAFIRELPSATHAICWEFSRRWFAVARRLRVLATPGAGRELLPSEDEVPSGVRKFHGGFHGPIMGETVVAYMLAWCRGLMAAYGWQKEGGDANLWRRADFGNCCYSLAGTKAVILGYGKIGRPTGAKLKALGVSVMRHDATFKLKAIEGYTWEDALRDMVPAIREVSEYAAKKGIRTCSENHGYIFQDSERVEALIRAVDHENYRWLVDLGNFLCVDEDPLSAVRRAAPYAVHVHAKDFLYHIVKEGVPKPEGYFGTRNGNLLRGTVVGHGVVPIPECVKVLREAGYDEWISLEFEGMEDNIPALSAGLAYLRRVTEGN